MGLVAFGIGMIPLVIIEEDTWTVLGAWVSAS